MTETETEHRIREHAERYLKELGERHTVQVVFRDPPDQPLLYCIRLEHPIFGTIVDVPIEIGPSWESDPAFIKSMLRVSLSS